MLIRLIVETLQRNESRCMDDKRDRNALALALAASLDEHLSPVKAFLRYSWEPIGYDYDGLTPSERELCDRDTFEMLAAWVQS